MYIQLSTDAKSSLLGSCPILRYQEKQGDIEAKGSKKLRQVISIKNIFEHRIHEAALIHSAWSQESGDMNKSIIVMNWFLLNNKQKQSKPFLRNSVCYIFPGHPVEDHQLGISPFL